jgi:hypothetical protein
MKATFIAGIKGITGKLDGAIYYYHPKLRKVLVRKFPNIPHQPQNDTYGSVAKALAALKPSDGYKNNFKSYLSILRDEKPDTSVASWYNLFTKMMWALQAKYPDSIDLRAITRAQIEEQGLPCRTVRSAVEDGLLPVVSGYEQLNNTM